MKIIEGKYIIHCFTVLFLQPIYDPRKEHTIKNKQSKTKLFNLIKNHPGNFFGSVKYATLLSSPHPQNLSYLFGSTSSFSPVFNKATLNSSEFSNFNFRIFKIKN